MEAFERIQEKTMNKWLGYAFSKGATEHTDFFVEGKLESFCRGSLERIPETPLST